MEEPGLTCHRKSLEDYDVYGGGGRIYSPGAAADSVGSAFRPYYDALKHPGADVTDRSEGKRETRSMLLVAR